MHDPLPLLTNTTFPPMRRSRLATLQVNLGYLCNQSCVHCHVNAGPKRTEQMTARTANQYAYDCDFNQVLGLPMRLNGSPRTHLADLLGADIEGRPIAIRDHCFGCTAGQGSSCGGALN